MKILDCDLSFGKYVNKTEFKPCETLAELEDNLIRCGISGGLVRTSTTDIVGLKFGNERLPRQLSEARLDLKGVWALSPLCAGSAGSAGSAGYAGDVPKPQDLPCEMKKHNVAALYINPGAHRFLPCPSVMGDYYAMAEEKHIPVMLNTWYDGLTVSDIDGIMASFPRLVCILSLAESWPVMRKVYPFFEHYENLVLDTAYQWDDCGVEDIVRRYGAHRLVFGSGFPNLYMGGMLAYIRCAEISDEAKTAIFSGNLEGIMKKAVLC